MLTSLKLEFMWLVDPPLAEIDTRSGDVVVAPPSSALAAGMPGSVRGNGTPAGRYPIKELAVLGRSEDEPVPVHTALAAIMPLVQEDMSSGATLDGVLRTLSRISLTRIRRASSAALEERISGE